MSFMKNTVIGIKVTWDIVNVTSMFFLKSVERKRLQNTKETPTSLSLNYFQ